jgi:hypothetical protein
MRSAPNDVHGPQATVREAITNAYPSWPHSVDGVPRFKSTKCGRSDAVGGLIASIASCSGPLPAATQRGPGRDDHAPRKPSSNVGKLVADRDVGDARTDREHAPYFSLPMTDGSTGRSG